MEEMFARLVFDLKLDQELLPWGYFEIMIGTGLGGLVVILIGRLRLSLSNAVEAYMKLVSVIPTEPAKDEEEKRHNTEAFQSVFLEVLNDAGFNEDAPMQDKEGTKVIICASSTFNLSSIYPIRSYRTRRAQSPTCTILQAACACIASPITFLPISIGSGHHKVTLFDALTIAANPSKELLREAQQVFGEDAEVATMMSLGAGRGDVWNMSETSSTAIMGEALRRSTMSGEPVHEELYARLRDTGIYFRLNVDRGSGPQMELANVSAYLEQGAVSDRLDNAIKSIHLRPTGVTLKDLNSVAVIEIALKPRPSLVNNFIGREDVLENMRQNHFTPRSTGSRKPAITVLSGLGGAGKTQTALKFALEFEEKYPDVPVYFVNASAEGTLRADLENIIRSRGIEYRSSSYQDAITWLATKSGDWLVIMDNADDPTFRIFPYIPQSFQGNIIITTRNVNHAALAPKNSHHLEGLSTEDAINLILTAAGIEDTPANRALARVVVEELGHLPLALAQAAGYILVHKCLSTYLEIYRPSRADLLNSLVTELPHDYQASVATTISMSLKQLPQAVQDMMRIFAHFEHTSIARSIISKAGSGLFCKVVGTDESNVRSETQQHAKDLMEIFCPSGIWSESEFNKLIKSCLQYSLLRVTSQGDEQFYSMHILVQSYLQATLSVVQGQYLRRLVVRLLGSPITLSTGNEHLAFNRAIFPHLRLIRMEDVIEGGDHRAFGHVMERVGNDKLALPHFERCVEIWKESLGEEHENTLWAMMDLANSYKMRGTSQQAVELEEKVLGIRKKTLGPEHRNTLKTSGNLASSYTRLGRHVEATELHEQVLEVQKRVLGPEDPNTVLTMSNLAISYVHLGRNEEALELQKQVLELQKKLLGRDDPITLQTMSNLADSYRRVGRSQEALEVVQQALQMETMVMGPEHPNTLTTMFIQLLVLRDLGMTEQLIDLLRIALPVHNKVLGTDHPRTAGLKKTFSLEFELLDGEQTSGPS